jgi:hypothetical protein
MKLSFLRPSLLLAAVLGVALAACGGKAQFDVGGPISGLVYSGLELTNLKNGEVLAVPAGATSFKMTRSIDYGTEYDVKPTKQPAHQTCSIGNGADTAGRMASINIGVLCSIAEYSIGGAVSGLTGTGLVVVNGSLAGEQLAIAKDATTYVMPKTVPYDTTYGVVILSQPTGLKCTVANGVGKMGDASVTNINITCVPAGIGG